MSKILLVDDSPEILTAYGKVLERNGNQVDTAEDGLNAITLLDKCSYDVIFSDISMPKMDGMTFLRRVREKDLDVPVVLMTGAPGLHTAVQAIEYGAFQYLIKPVTMKALQETLERAVRFHGIAKLKRLALQSIGEEGKWLGDFASLEIRFAKALDSVWMAFQPIVSWKDQKTVAYEALLRCEETTLMHPGAFLQAAERLGRLFDLGRSIRSFVARAAQQAPSDAKLFVNLHSLDLNDEELFSRTSPLTKIAPRVVLEITERASLHNVADVRGKVAALRNLGFGFAVDDLGAGYAGLTSLAHIEPEIVKLDMSLTREISQFPNKQQIVQSLSRLCDELGMQVITEGVETLDECNTLTNLNCNLFQGFLFAKPARSFVAPTWGNQLQSA